MDARIRVIVPVCMMSAHYQGGCPCEEPPLIHLDDLTTLDVVASLAPRPVLLPSVTGDWTNQNPSHDVPAVRQIYAIFGAADRIENVHFDAPHNYNRDTREHMYAWFCRWLMNDLKAGRRIAEPKLTPPTAEALRLFPEGKPPRGYRTGKALLRDLAAREEAAFADPPASAAGLRALKTAWREVYSEVLGAAEPQEIVSVGRCMRPRADAAGSAWPRASSGATAGANRLPRCGWTPRGADANSPAALAVCGNGKAELFRNGAPSPLLSALLNAGFRVLAIDLLGKGETAPLFEKVREDLKDPIFYAFNRSLTAHRVQEILRRPGRAAAVRRRPEAGDRGDRRRRRARAPGAAAGRRLARHSRGPAWMQCRGRRVLARGNVPPAHPESSATCAAPSRWRPPRRCSSRARTRPSADGAGRSISLQGKRKRLRLLPGALVPRVVASWL